MLNGISNFQNILYLSIGAILGSNLRLRVLSFSMNSSLEKYWLTSCVNISSSFLLGFCVASVPNFVPVGITNEVILFFSVGFLGSFSTFSTFTFDLFSLIHSKKYIVALRLFSISLTFSLLAAFVGYSL